MDIKEENSEIVAWIAIDNTSIDYPVMQAENNSYYLTHDYKGDYSVAGSIYLDYRNNNFKDDYLVLYGHHMDGGRMFGEISAYSDEGFLKDHRKGKIYTTEQIYDIEIMAFATVNTGIKELYRVGEYGVDEVVWRINDYILTGSMQDWDHERIIMMSTCNSLHSGDRDIVLAKILE